MIQNLYVPYRMRVAKVTPEAPSVVTFRLEFVDPADAERFDFKAGQFGEYSVYGEGESTFCIASAPTRKGYIECTFRQVGRVTTALADRDEGDIIGFRGPYGNVFPIEQWRGKKLLFIAGGIALPPMRCVIWRPRRAWGLNATGMTPTMARMTFRPWATMFCPWNGDSIPPVFRTC